MLGEAQPQQARAPQLSQRRGAQTISLSRAKSELLSGSLPLRSTLLIKICSDLAGQVLGPPEAAYYTDALKFAVCREFLLRAQLLILTLLKLPNWNLRNS